MHTPIDPSSLKVGDEVEVCFADNSGSTVWSYPAKVALRGKTRVLEPIDDDNPNYCGENAMTVAYAARVHMLTERWPRR